MSESIRGFKGEYKFLSNFYESKIEINGIVYNSAENMYQAAKTRSRKMKEKIAVMTPGQAKRTGRSLTMREDWEEIKVMVMHKVVGIKFEQNSNLAIKLIETGERQIIEENNWGDTFWGECNGQGQNMLGKVLMEVRKSLKGRMS